MTNEADSPAARLADAALVTRAGREEAVPASKSFTTALGTLLVLARDLGAAPADPDDAPPLVEAGLDEEDRLRAFLAQRPDRTAWFFLAGAPLLPLAREAALKMMETAQLPAFALPAGELAHGPAALLSPATPVVALGPSPERSDEAARAAGAPVLPLPATGPLAAFRLAPPIQLLAAFEGKARGVDVNRPPGLMKSVVDD